MLPTSTATRLSEHVYWVGAIDWDIRDFHGYSTERGTTYNAYLVVGDRITLVDTVKRPFLDQLLARISSVVDPSKIDYVISNHAEMDHSGCLPEIIQMVKPEKVFASAMGVKNLTDHFGLGVPLTVVKDGEKAGLGNLSFEFAETRMLHWPDSMFTILHDDGVLFSSDAFGMHLASEERFVDETEGWDYQAAKYYANILMPLSGMVGKVLSRLSGVLEDARMIAPDHGPLWRKDLRTITSLYSGWSAQRPTRKAVVAFDTMWGSTASMAASLADGLSTGNADVRLMPLQQRHRSDVVTELLEAGALLVGSPTLNNNLLPTLADLLTYLRGLKPKGLIGMAFGSYGWSGEGVGQVRDYLSAIGVEMLREDLRFKFVPKEAELAQCRQQGLSLAEHLMNG